jgi:hypothetical protein
MISQGNLSYSGISITSPGTNSVDLIVFLYLMSSSIDISSPTF